MTAGPRLPAAFAAGLFVACLTGLSAGQETASAQTDDAAAGPIGLELNAIETVGENCRITLVASNRTAHDIGKLVVEVALIDRDGAVADFLRITVLPVEPRRSRAQRFDIAGRTCGTLSRFLLNDVPTCTDAAGEVLRCAPLIAPSSRTAIDFVTNLFGD